MFVHEWARQSRQLKDVQDQNTVRPRGTTTLILKDPYYLTHLTSGSSIQVTAKPSLPVQDSYMYHNSNADSIVDQQVQRVYWVNMIPTNQGNLLDGLLELSVLLVGSGVKAVTGIEAAHSSQNMLQFWRKQYTILCAPHHSEGTQLIPAIAASCALFSLGICDLYTPADGPVIPEGLLSPGAKTFSAADKCNLSTKYLSWILQTDPSTRLRSKLGRRSSNTAVASRPAGLSWPILSVNTHL